MDADAEIAKKKRDQLLDYQRNPYGVWANSYTSQARKRTTKGSAFERFK